MRKKSKIIAVVILLFLGGGIGLYLAAQPPSIEHLKKHPEDFTFYGWGTNQKFLDVLNDLFPYGTPKSKVTEYFSASGLVENSTRNEEEYCYYSIQYNSNEYGWRDNRYLNAIILFDKKTDLVIGHMSSSYNKGSAKFPPLIGPSPNSFKCPIKE